jgi:hypothetical protein
MIIIPVEDTNYEAFCYLKSQETKDNIAHIFLVTDQDWNRLNRSEHEAVDTSYAVTSFFSAVRLVLG